LDGTVGIEWVVTGWPVAPRGRPRRDSGPVHPVGM